MNEGWASRLPRYLEERGRRVRLGDVPALVAHPDWERPAPWALWLHGRTARKELDPGRYLRWLRAGIGVCAVDLPGHGERYEERLQGPGATLEVIGRAVSEIDGVVSGVVEGEGAGVFDGARVALGGMSAGGMAALRRLCEPHGFVCATVEATTGDLGALYHPRSGRRWVVEHPRERVAEVDPAQHLGGWRPIPLLALHSRADRLVPWETQEGFLARLGERYREAGADPALIEVLTWEETGAPEEHLGFGRHSNEAKNAQTAFLARHLGVDGAAGG